MKEIKSLYFYAIQFSILVVQTLMLKYMFAPNYSALVLVGILFACAVILLIESYFKKLGNKYFFIIEKIIFVLLIGILVYQEVIAIYHEIILLTNGLLYVDSNPLLAVLTSPDVVFAISFVSIYVFMKLSFRGMYTGDINILYIVTSAVLIVMAVILRRASVPLIITLVTLISVSTLLVSAQQPTFIFKKKIFLPIVLSVLLCTLFSIGVTVISNYNYRNPSVAAIGLMEEVISGIIERFDTDETDDGFTADVLFNHGVENLKEAPLEGDLPKDNKFILDVNNDFIQKLADFLSGDGDTKEESKDDENLPEEIETNGDTPESNNDDQSTQEELEKKYGNSEMQGDGNNDSSSNGPNGALISNEGGSCKNCNSPKVTVGELCEDCANEQPRKSKPGIGSGALSNNSVSFEEQYVVLKVKSRSKEPYLKAFSGGKYDTEMFRFENKTSPYMQSVIEDINNSLHGTSSFEEIFTEENEDAYLEVTNINAEYITYFPYGLLDFDTSTYLVGDNYFAMYNPFDYKNYSLHISDEPFSSFPYKEELQKYEVAVYKEYLQVPESMRYTLQQFLVDHGLDYTSNDKASLIRGIQNIFASGEFHYSLNPGELPEGQELITYFLTDNKIGYCQHFAGAATLLFRTCGIPTRFVSGYVIDNYNDEYIATVLNINAHAWAEVYDVNKGWIPIEVTLAPMNENESMPTPPPSGAETKVEELETSEQEDAIDEMEEATEKASPPAEAKEESTDTEEEVDDEEEPSEKDDKKADDATDDESVNEQEEQQEEEKEEDKEEEEEVEKEFGLDAIAGEFNLETLLLLIAIFVPIIGIIIFLLYRHYKKRKLAELDVYDKILMEYFILKKYDFVSPEVYSMMERIRFSNYPANEDDLTFIQNHKNELVKQLFETKGFNERLKIYIKDRLPVLESGSALMKQLLPRVIAILLVIGLLGGTIYWGISRFAFKDGNVAKFTTSSVENYFKVNDEALVVKTIHLDDENGQRAYSLSVNPSAEIEDLDFEYTLKNEDFDWLSDDILAQVKRAIFASEFVYPTLLEDYGLANDDAALYHATHLVLWSLVENWPKEAIIQEDLSDISDNIYALYSDLYDYALDDQNKTFEEGALLLNVSSDTKVDDNQSIALEKTVYKASDGTKYYRTPKLCYMSEQFEGMVWNGDFAFRYIVNLKDAPKGTRVVNENGAPQTEFSTFPGVGTDFFIEVPLDAEDVSFSVEIETTSFYRKDLAFYIATYSNEEICLVTTPLMENQDSTTFVVEH